MAENVTGITCNQLVKLLERSKSPVCQWTQAQGGMAVTTQRGARLAGLFPSGDSAAVSALWSDPDMEANLANGGAGMGGDRFWIAPERDLFYTKPREFSDWSVQTAMEPGAFEIIEDNASSVRYENRLALSNYLQGVTYRDVRMQRRCSALENPLLACNGAVGVLQTVGYAGVEIVDSVEFPEQRHAPSLMCPWALTQVAPTGTVVIPTAHRAVPIHYFDVIPDDRLRVRDDYVTFKIDGEHKCKLGIRPEDLAHEGPIRIAYLRPLETKESGEETWHLVVRESEDIARIADDAVDPTVSNPDGPRGVIQAFNNGPVDASADHVRVGEIEMQFLPIRRESSGLWKSRSVSRLMAFQGARTDILATASSILGVESIDLFE